MTPQKILVALDRSVQAPIVFERALELAAQFNSSLMLFHCFDWERENKPEAFLGIGTLGDVDLYGTALGGRREYLTRQLERDKDWLQSYARQALQRGIKTDDRAQVGDPGVRICQMAREWEANLVVLGRRGHQGISEVLLGSVSNYVLHHAPCSVLVVQTSSEVLEPSV